MWKWAGDAACHLLLVVDVQKIHLLRKRIFMRFTRRLCQGLVLLATLGPSVQAQEDAISLTVANQQAVIDLPLVPGTEEYQVYSTPDLNFDFSLVTGGVINGFMWSKPVTEAQAFYQVKAVPMAHGDMMAALLLNRLGYGPTPDELDRVRLIGADAYIAEQLAPEEINESLDIDRVTTSRDWQRVIVTGVPTAAPFYIYLTAVGDAYLDDVKLVAGTNPDAAGNLLKNGDFEAPLSGTWTVGTNLTNSVIESTGTRSGSGALHLIATSPGSTDISSIRQTVSPITLNTTHTLSYWWKPGTNLVSGLTLRFSGRGIETAADTIPTKLEAAMGTTDDLRAWHVMHAVRSKKQLQETLLQFLENHFVTQVSKTRDYFDGIYNNGMEDRVASRMEYKEIQRWRQALNSPTCTFSNLLTISVESPAQIIYLDTVNSRGNGSNIPNENYARELLELFTFGVDNGYDQTDITLLSRAWTGWSVDIVDPAQELNPMAARSQTLRPGGTNLANVENLAGVWAFNYKNARHWNQGSTILFPGKKVPDRFGAPHAGRDYTLGVDVDANVSQDWQRVVVTGTASSSTLYMYLSGPGDIYLDDIKIVAGTVADPVGGVNRVTNGDFENGLTGWTVSLNHSGSAIETTGAHGGTRALHMRASSGGSTQGSSIYRGGLGLTSGQPYTLSFWWKPGDAAGSSVTLRLSGSGIVATAPERLPGSGLAEGYRVVAHLSNLPFTQEFISVKLCHLFVHDRFSHGVYDYRDPNLSAEGKLVRACMEAWENNAPKGQIRKVLKTIFDSELFRSQAAARHKVKTPLEFTVSAVRGLRSENANGTFTSNTDGYQIKTPLDRMGAMKLFDRAEPDGYPETASPWISAGTLAERLRWVQALCMAPNASGREDAGSATVSDPVTLLKRKLPSNKWNDAGAVADYFLALLLPGEGKANLDLHRTAAISFLNTTDTGLSQSPFVNLVNTSATYDTRVRGMVAMVMASQRFQEQ